MKSDQQKMWCALEGEPMADEDRPRTYHNIECARLRGRRCDCQMAVTIIPPRHFTPIDPINYDFDTQPTVILFDSRDVEVRIDGVVVDIFHPWAGGETPREAAHREYPSARMLHPTLNANDNE